MAEAAVEAAAEGEEASEAAEAVVVAVEVLAPAALKGAPLAIARSPRRRTSSIWPSTWTSRSPSSSMADAKVSPIPKTQPTSTVFLAMASCSSACPAIPLPYHCRQRRAEWGVDVASEVLDRWAQAQRLRPAIEAMTPWPCPSWLTCDLVRGTLKGYDALMNLVLDDVQEVMRGQSLSPPSHICYSTKADEKLRPPSYRR